MGKQGPHLGTAAWFIDRWQRKRTGQKEIKSEDINLFCNGWSDIKVIGDWSCGQGLVNTNYALSSTTALRLLIILLLAFTQVRAG